MAKDHKKDDKGKDHKKPGKGKSDSYGSKKAEKQLNKQAKSAMAVEYGPQIRENKQAVRESKRVSKAIPKLWKGYDEEAKDAQRSTEDAYSRAASSIRDQANRNYDSDIQNARAVDERNAAEAARSGQDYKSTGEAEKAAAARDAYNSQNAATQDTLGAHATAYFGDARRIGKGTRNMQLQAERTYRKDLRRDKRDLIREKGRWITDYISKLRQERAQTATEAAAFGLDKAELASLDSYRQGQLKQRGKDRKADRKESQRDRDFERSENQKDRDSREKISKHNGGSGSHGLSDTEKANVRKTTALGRDLIAKGQTLAQIKTIFHGEGVDPKIIKIAWPALKKAARKHRGAPAGAGVGAGLHKGSKDR